MRFQHLTRTKLLIVLSVGSLLVLGMVWSAIAESPGDNLLQLFDVEVETKILPAGVTVAATFEDGPGDAVGAVEFVRNDTFVVHSSNEKTAYRLKKGLAVYQGDLLLSDTQSSLIVLLNDKSQLTLGAYTKLRIDKSVYNPEKSFRETLLNMLIGKVRYVVTKLKSKEQNFRVETPLATLGVRGSDFAVTYVGKEASKQYESTSWLQLFTPPPAHAQSFGNDIFLATGDDTHLELTPKAGAAFSAMQVNSNTATLFSSSRMISHLPITVGLYSQTLRRTMPSASVMDMPEILE